MLSDDRPDEASEESSTEDGSEEAEAPPEVEDPGIDQRLWLQACLKVIGAHTIDKDTSVRVQFAIDRAVIAACERCVRILTSDLREEE